MSKLRAPIVEVFSSLQGEGVRLGERQIFVRFGGCNLRCDYCDQPEAVGQDAGESWDEARLQERILRLNGERRHRTVSWTGGEPLLHVEFLGRMAIWAKEQGFENYLETNGVLAKRLRLVADRMDAVAVDIKLPSATGRSTWSAHAEFLKAAPKGSFVKVVLTDSSTAGDWEEVLRLMEDHAPALPLVLQPATPKGPAKAPSPEKVLDFMMKAKSRLSDVRIVPQWHPVWGVR